VLGRSVEALHDPLQEKFAGAGRIEGVVGFLIHHEAHSVLQEAGEIVFDLVEEGLVARIPGGKGVFWLRLADRYEDIGLVCVAVVRFEDRTASIDSLLLSCRAANRGIERTMVSHLASVARERDCHDLIGHYVPTQRNAVVRELYGDLGLSLDVDDPSTRRYRHDLRAHPLDRPDHIEVLRATTA
jgi:hypothetical protein